MADGEKQTLENKTLVGDRIAESKLPAIKIMATVVKSNLKKASDLLPKTLFQQDEDAISSDRPCKSLPDLVGRGR